jgi:hypothetical protein
MMNHDKKHFQVLEYYAALPVEGHEEDWKQLMPLFQLQVGHIASVQLVLAKGTWRKANDPVSYIRSAAWKEQRKLDGPRRPPKLVGCISELNLPCSEDGIFMEHDEAIDFLYKEPTSWESLVPYAKQRVHAKFLIPDSTDEDAEYTIDYSKLMDEVASLAGLSKPRRDAIEKVLVWLATAHITREQILSYPIVGARKQLQAALRWVNQNKALLSKVLSRQR